MKQTLLQFAQYNLWANKLMVDAIQKLTPEQLDMTITSSFDSIRKTIMHTYAAEYVWLQRLQLAEHPVWVGNATDKSIEEVCQHWLQVSEELLAFVNKQFDDRALEHVVQYQNLQQVQFKTPVFEVLTHIFNHATYHRGQLVTMMRQAGVTQIPGTDYILWSRKA